MTPSSIAGLPASGNNGLNGSTAIDLGGRACLFRFQSAVPSAAATPAPAKPASSARRETLTWGEDASGKPALPESEAYHDEDIGVVRNFRPWIVAAVIAILISYIPPLIQVLGANYPLVSE